MMKLAPEGYPFILGAAGLTALAFLFQPVATIVPALLTAFMLYFFRDPERNAPDDKDVFVAPADGKVILIRQTHEAKYLKKDVREISIFMSPMNVHVNRAPCDGRVKQVVHNKGRFHAAYKDEASLQNENIEMVLETEYGDVLVRQVAGFVARRAVCRKAAGDGLKRGERYGVIKFSSRVDLYLPLDAKIRVGVGEMVRAGETIIGGM
ncbi:MAG: phosphatidylserine decarboxylase family protein [Nitrospiraceae bacterium]|nr:phosphatidylserine decarboxylase family protein [Nitrospiraceae bacterium]